MIQLKSEIPIDQLITLIKDIYAGSVNDYTFLPSQDTVYVSTHEIGFDSDDKVKQFSINMKPILNDIFKFDKDIEPFRYVNSDPTNSIFISLFTY